VFVFPCFFFTSCPSFRFRPPPLPFFVEAVCSKPFPTTFLGTPPYPCSPQKVQKSAGVQFLKDFSPPAPMLAQNRFPVVHFWSRSGHKPSPNKKWALPPVIVFRSNRTCIPPIPSHNFFLCLLHQRTPSPIPFI